jgi:hypothetical protein
LYRARAKNLLDDLRQTTIVRSGKDAPEIEFFFAPANKRLALAPALFGIYFGYFFIWGKEKVTPTRDKTLCKT